MADGQKEAELDELTAECERSVKEDPARLSWASTAGVITACTTSGFFCGWEEINDTESLSQRYAFVSRLFSPERSRCLRRSPGCFAFLATGSLPSMCATVAAGHGPAHVGISDAASPIESLLPRGPECRRRADLNTDFNIVIHDDACHMARLFRSARRKLRRDDPLQKRLLDIVWILDRFHAKSHKGEWCKQNVMPDLPFLAPLIKGHNTETCEQTNSWLAGFQHIVRHMPKFTFRFFMASNMALHNELLSRGASAFLQRS